LRVTCAPAVLEHVFAEARSAEPAECCGLLLGSPGHIVEAVRARNLSPDPNRFLIDPQAHIAALRDARSRELEVIGFYHSHPHSDARPSPTDIVEVTYDGCLYLIVSLVREPAARLFRMDPDGPIELDLEIASNSRY
jgi:proteasome lid subunit RPN8/RPN11